MSKTNLEVLVLAACPASCKPVCLEKPVLKDEPQMNAAVLNDKMLLWTASESVSKQCLYLSGLQQLLILILTGRWVGGEQICSCVFLSSICICIFPNREGFLGFVLTVVSSACSTGVNSLMTWSNHTLSKEELNYPIPQERSYIEKNFLDIHLF